MLKSTDAIESISEVSATSDLELLIPIIAVIVGSIVTVAGIFIQSLITKRAEKRQLMRQKLEELYLVSEEVETYARDNMNLVAHIAGLAPSTDNTEPVQNSSTFRLVMLAKIYQPSLARLSEDLRDHAEQILNNVRNILLQKNLKNIEPTEADYIAAIQPLNDVEETAHQLRREIERAIAVYL